MYRIFSLCLLLLLILSCQPMPVTQPQSPPIASTAPPTAAFTQETLYALLVAELAGQRQRPEIALAQYRMQAQTTQDAGVTERAYQIAAYLEQPTERLELALLWSRLAPHNQEALSAAALELAHAERYAESLVYLERIALAQGNPRFDLLAESAVASDSATRQALIGNFDRLFKKYPDNAWLWFGKALLLHEDHQPKAALEVLERAPKKTQNNASTILQAQLLYDLSQPQKALTLLEQRLKKHPHNHALQSAYARLLVAENQLEAAKQVFIDLLQQYPENAKLRLTLALLYMDTKAWAEAAVYLQALVDEAPYADLARIHLGLTYEAQGKLDDALDQYAAIRPGNDYLRAQALQTKALLQAKQPHKARQRLAQARHEQPGYGPALFLLEMQLLEENGYALLAWETGQVALKTFPGDPDLLLSRALLTHSQQNLAAMEQDLRQVLTLQPNNAIALNALGYTLADRTKRYAEAKALIERAHALLPKDPAILDSMGWIAYRLGDLAQARAHLEKAYQLLPEAEIAAHLGEVLWMQGEYQAAQQIWQKGLTSAPNSAILQETIQRLTRSTVLP